MSPPQGLSPAQGWAQPLQTGLGQETDPAQELLEQEISNYMEIIFGVRVYFGTLDLIIQHFWDLACEVTKIKGVLSGSQFRLFQHPGLYLGYKHSGMGPSSGFPVSGSSWAPCGAGQCWSKRSDYQNENIPQNMCEHIMKSNHK